MATNNHGSDGKNIKHDSDDDDIPLVNRKKNENVVKLEDVNSEFDKFLNNHSSKPVKPKLSPTVNNAKSHASLGTSQQLKTSPAKTPTPSISPIKIKREDASTSKIKRKHESDESDDDDDERPLVSRVLKKPKVEDSSQASSSKGKRAASLDNNHKAKHDKKHANSNDKRKSAGAEPSVSPRKKKKEEPEDVWRWWEEEKHAGGIQWKFLEHQGPVFAPPYQPLPDDVHFKYDGKPMKLSEPAEEIATFYGKMLEHEFTQRKEFNDNFFKDWRKRMTAQEKTIVIDLKKCNFQEICEYFKQKSEERKNMSKEEKLAIKAENERLQKQYGFATVDGHKQKIGNFKIEPPGLFRGRGDHPKMGMLKKRVNPEDVIINCSKDAKVPAPPEGHRWKEVRHDNTVTWLATWTENVQGQNKYIMLNPSSKIKGEKDWEKYEKARKLKDHVHKIREDYQNDFKAREMAVRQRAVAVYLIDRLALRAGNEKEEGETADTVGCCSLRVEHIKLHDNIDGKDYVVDFDFLGKDSIRYLNRVAVEKRVYKNLKIFLENKKGADDLFDRLNTSLLNKYLQSQMDGLTAKVFRTYNASFTLQQQLDELTKPEMNVNEKMLAYNRANRQVALLCNHQRAPPKTFDKQMETLNEKIAEKKALVKAAKKEKSEAENIYKKHKTDKYKKVYDQKKQSYARLKDQLKKLELQATDKMENKEIALGTSKLNYLDPRISIAWCKKHDVPIEKIYSKTQREKFHWAIDMATEDYHF